MERVYRASPIWLQEALVGAYGARVRLLRYGQDHDREVERLRQTEWLPAGDLRALQESAWVEIRRTGEATSLYRDLWKGVPAPRDLDQLSELPRLSKQCLRLAGRKAVPDPVAGRRLLQIHTGGTTGSPLTIYCARASLQRNYAFFSRLLGWAGLGAHPRTATFGGRLIVPVVQQDPPFWRWNRPGNTLLFSSYHLSPAAMPAYVGMLARFRPALIDAYPSSIEPIARWMVAEGRSDIRPQAVITSSETLTSEVRSVIESAFGCRVHDYYGAAEMAAFISQCEHGTYHPNPEFGVVEVVSDGRPAAVGEVGEIVATGFVNPFMPLIRYATGDLAKVGAGPCPCGRAFPVLASVEGRRDDVLVTPEGRRVGCLDTTLKKVDSIFESRLVQDEADHVTVEIVQQGDLSPRDVGRLLEEVRLRLGPRMRVDIRRVESIPRTSRGKFRAVVNLVSG